MRAWQPAPPPLRGAWPDSDPGSQARQCATSGGDCTRGSRHSWDFPASQSYKIPKALPEFTGSLPGHGGEFVEVGLLKVGALQADHVAACGFVGFAPDVDLARLH